MIPDGSFRAYVVEDHADHLRRTVRLILVADRGRYEDVLMGDGTWLSIDAGTVTKDPPGILLPRGSVEAVLAAIESWQGRANHAATEAAVLREWLAVERDRVDKAGGWRR